MKTTISKSYRKKLKLGGPMTPEQEAQMGLIGGSAAFGAGMVDALSPANSYGRQSTGSMAASGALKGAAAGAALGPPGAIVGGAIGLATGWINGARAKKEEDRMVADQTLMKNLNEKKAMNMRLAADPSLTYGDKDAQYFATGGNMVQKSSDGKEVQGATHEEGGVNVPGTNANVEDKETIRGSYVFSELLGFAKLHKPLMVAKGKIEQKPASPERVNAIKRINMREDRLMEAQEYMKKKFNIK